MVKLSLEIGSVYPCERGNTATILHKAFSLTNGNLFNH
jgi:hypothetical protein